MTQVIPRPDDHGVRGWCPTALRPMETGDGLIVRLDARGKSLPPADLAAIASVAEKHGNGLIDLTRRANLQLRGISEAGLPLVWSELACIGMLDDEAGRRNILLGPLAGIDSSELVDASSLARSLAAGIADAPALSALPDKFSFLIDGGGLLPLDDEAADIRLRALHIARGPAIALAIEGPRGARWLGTAAPSAAPGLAVKLAKTFLQLRSPTHRRMRDLSDVAAAALPASLGAALAPMDAVAPRAAYRPLGIVRGPGGTIAVGISAPFGRITAQSLHRLSEAAARLGIAALRISPWRSLYAITDNGAAAAGLTAAAVREGFVVDPADPLLSIDACPGAPACASSSIDTRDIARALAPHLDGLGIGSCHVSGCGKGCARSSAADLTLVGARGSLAIVRHGTARSAPRHIVPQNEFASLPQLLKAL